MENVCVQIRPNLNLIWERVENAFCVKESIKRVVVNPPHFSISPPPFLLSSLSFFVFFFSLKKRRKRKRKKERKKEKERERKRKKKRESGKRERSAKKKPRTRL